MQQQRARSGSGSLAKLMPKAVPYGLLRRGGGAAATAPSPDSHRHAVASPLQLSNSKEMNP
jgi:hypothetical protein